MMIRLSIVCSRVYMFCRSVLEHPICQHPVVLACVTGILHFWTAIYFVYTIEIEMWVGITGFLDFAHCPVL
jgi:ABC-type branched-subunit amino acid transport system permease subunit